MISFNTVPRVLFAIAIVVFGVQHLMSGEFVTRLVPRPPAWVPGHHFLADATGTVLICAGVALFVPRFAGIAGALLGSLLLLSFLLLYVPALLTSPPLSSLWTNAGKVLSISGGSFLISLQYSAG